jgi:glycosyltransferase involved in cell wall biosynthesis
MKIGFDAKRLFCNNTGLGNYSRSLVQQLQHFHPEASYHLFTPEARVQANTKVFFDDAAFHIHESKARMKAYWRSFSMVKDLQQTGIDLYHGLSNELPHNIKQTGIKSVVTIHDLIFKTQAQTYSLSERLIYDRKFRYACQQADHIVAISEHTKQDIIRLYNIDPEKISVIYQVCHAQFYQLRSTEELVQVQEQYHLPESFFLYVGSIEARKNLKLIVSAYQLLKPEERIPLVIVGKGGKYKDEVKAMIRAAHLDAYFIWQDNLSNNLHLQCLYQLAKALIYPSFYEGFGLPIAEALLCKTPVIAAQTSSLPEAGGPHSMYIDPNDATSLANAMSTLLQDATRCQNMSTLGYAYAHEQFSAARVGPQMIALYQQLLS